MSRVDTAFPVLRATHRLAAEAELKDYFADLKRDVAARFSSGASRLVTARWNPILAGLILDRNMATAVAVVKRVNETLQGEYDPESLRGWLEVNADASSEALNAKTESDIGDTDEDDPVDHVFSILAATGAGHIARQMVGTAAGLAAHDAAKAVGAAAKTWQVNSSSPRPAHAQMSGETVGFDELFSNGMRWPGDPSGGADNNAECRCSLTIVR